MADANVQSTSDREPNTRSMSRPADQAMRGGGTIQDGGADRVDLGMSPMRPPYSRAPMGEVQDGGADKVDGLAESGGSWPWQPQAGNITKP